MEKISTSQQTLIDRLEIFMETFKLNNNQLSSRAGLSNGLLGKARKNRSAMNSDSIEQILYAFPELDADWLLTGRGEMIRSTNIQSDSVLLFELKRLNINIKEIKKERDEWYFKARKYEEELQKYKSSVKADEAV
ncbi:MAG: hypothetical protein LUH63_12265 [Parabacteroides sp.]|nr:hypothetical protein [Parabacteroides sp.]